ncbi:MAG: hypothetical protein JXI43_06890, partial [Tissierellales bacterium]|nr:hypothetical protein [Tissierellales bacterium]
MKTKKIFSLILVMTIILSGMTAVFGFTQEGPISGNDNDVLKSYTEYTGSINPSKLCYYIKDESPGTDKNVDLGYGYSIDLDYSEDNDYVTPTLNSPTSPTHTIEIKFINVKASPSYLKYTDLLLDGTEDLYSVYNDTNGKYHGISHVSVAYCFTPINQPEYGTLTIEKELWIDGVKQEENTETFTFTVDGETVTASAVEVGSIQLETGSYVVTETGYGDYTPDAVTQQAIVTTQGGLVTFINRYTTP